MSAGNPAEDDAHQHEGVRSGHRRLGRQGDLELIDAVLGVELFDLQSGSRGGLGDLANEVLVLEDSGQAVLRPQFARQSRPVGGDEEELDLVSDHRGQARRGEICLDARQRRTRTRRHRRTILIEERCGRPRESVADGSQAGRVDAHPFVADDADRVGERDAGLVDGEAVPGRAGTQSGVGELRRPADGDCFGQSQAGGIDDGADEGSDAVGFQLGDRRAQRRLSR